MSDGQGKKTKIIIGFKDQPFPNWTEEAEEKYTKFKSEAMENNLVRVNDNEYNGSRPEGEELIINEDKLGDPWTYAAQIISLAIDNGIAYVSFSFDD